MPEQQPKPETGTPEEGQPQGQTQEEPKPEEVSPGKEKKVSAKKFAAVQEELEKTKADRDHWRNQYYTAYADTQNLRRSLEAEQRTIMRYRAEGFLDGLLPALDAFHMALDAPAPTPEAANYQIGFTYIYNQIIQALSAEGLSELAPKVNDPFDPTYMNAIEVVETSEVAPNLVVKVHSKGYKLHDRLIKAAMVTVSKAPAEPKPEEPKPEQTPAEEPPAQA